MNIYPATFKSAVEDFFKSLSSDDLAFLEKWPVINENVDNGAYEYIDKILKYCNLSENQSGNDLLLADAIRENPDKELYETFLDERADPKIVARLILQNVILKAAERNANLY